MKTMTKLSFILVGLIVLGFYISWGLTHFKHDNNTVVVKGLAEQPVKANLAVWTPSVNIVSFSIKDATSKMKHAKLILTNYLEKAGFQKSNYNFDASIYENQNYNQNSKYTFTYNANLHLHLSTDKVQLLQKTANNVIELMAKNDLSINNSSPRYFFTNLNTIKGNLLNKATDAAFKAASVFAKKTHSKVGKIDKADQGVISILSPTRNIDSGSSINKIIRCVVTMTYYLN